MKCKAYFLIICYLLGIFSALIDGLPVRILFKYDGKEKQQTNLNKLLIEKLSIIEHFKSWLLHPDQLGRMWKGCGLYFWCREESGVLRSMDCKDEVCL